MFNNKLRVENAALRAKNAEIIQENEQLKAFIEAKATEEKAELERMQKMSNFWAYNGSVQEGASYD